LVLVPLVILRVMPALISLVPRLAPEGSLAFMDLERLPERLQYPMLGVRSLLLMLPLLLQPWRLQKASNCQHDLAPGLCRFT